MNTDEMNTGTDLLRRYGITAFVAVVLLAGFGYYVYKDYVVPKMAVTDGTQNATSTTPLATTTGVVINANDPNGYTVTQVPVNEGRVAPEPIPDLNRISTLPAPDPNFPQEAQTIAAQKIATLSASLKKDPFSYGAWIDLGIYRKMFKDYVGAQIAFEYAVKIGPDSNAAYLDLADLYENYLKDYVKAELFYRTAIEKDPTYVSSYVNLYRFYRYSLKNNVKALAALNEGLKQAPTNIDLMIAIAAYKKETGDIAGARASYMQARTEAAARGNDALVASIDAEIAALPK